MKTLLLIDANSLIHRAFHALPPLTAKDGRPAGAIYGISSILLKLFRETPPDYVAALFDRPEPTFRDEIYKEYKAQRPKAAEELVGQIIEARNTFISFGVPVFELAGFEADDLIATLVKRFRGERDLTIEIFTGDRDTLQLVEDDHILVRAPKKGLSDVVVYNEERVKEEYGLLPEQLVDYKSLVGDSSDNIKGVPGVGPKTARDILQQFKTLDAAFEKGKNDPVIEKRLIPFRDEAMLARKLVTLQVDAPLAARHLSELAPKFDEAEISSYFRGFGFEALLKRLHGEVAPPSAKKTKKTHESAQGRLI